MADCADAICKLCKPKVNIASAESVPVLLILIREVQPSCSDPWQRRNILVLRTELFECTEGADQPEDSLEPSDDYLSQRQRSSSLTESASPLTKVNFKRSANPWRPDLH